MLISQDTHGTRLPMRTCLLALFLASCSGGPYSRVSGADGDRSPEASVLIAPPIRLPLLGRTRPDAVAGDGTTSRHLNPEAAGQLDDPDFDPSDRGHESGQADDACARGSANRTSAGSPPSSSVADISCWKRSGGTALSRIRVESRHAQKPSVPRSWPLPRSRASRAICRAR